MNLDSTLFKYFNVVLLYDYAKLNYQAIDFDDTFAWHNPERETISQSFRIEASALLPLGGGASFRIGAGFAFDSLALDGAASVRSNRQYLTIGLERIVTTADYTPLIEF